MIYRWSVSALLSIVLAINSTLASAEPVKADKMMPSVAVKLIHPEKNGRPKIGLVLAGGGARGLAHIGVIKALEKQHIPIDYIAGTSIGALIGGLYAAGLPIDQIEHFARSADWENLFNDDPLRYYQSFRQKQSQYGYYVKGEAGMHHWQFRLPSGLLQGQKQDILLESLLLNVAPSKNFDTLPIPFRAVTTDIETGQRVVLNHGNLAKALRASMSVPGIFAPVKLYGHLLVDGGITDNTPVDVVRDMGADIVIVSDIHDPFANKEKLRSFVDITNQLITGLTLKNTLNQLASLHKQDILITPNLKDLSSTDFDQAETLIQRGEIATNAQQKRLAKLASRQPTSNHVKSAHSLLVKRIRFDNQTEISDAVIKSYLHQQTNEPLDRTQLETDLAYLYGLGFFKNLTYNFNNDEQQGLLIIHSRSPDWGPNFFKLKFNLSSNLNDNTQFNLGLRHIYKPANDLGAEWRNEVQIGEIQHLRSEFYQPLTNNQAYYVKPFVDYQQEGYLYNDPALGPFSLALDKNRVQTGLEMGVDLSNSNRLFADYFYENGQLELGHGTALQITNKYYQVSTGIGFTHDSLNQVTFPSNGTLLKMKFQGLSTDYPPSTETYTDQFELSHYLSYHRHTLNLYAEYADTNGPIGFQSNKFYTLGGFQRLSGFRHNELIGNQILFTRLKYRYRLKGKSNLDFNFPVYLGATLEAGNVFGDYTQPEKIDWQATRQAGSLFVGINTPVGPAYLAYGYHNNEKQSVYFYFGRSFN